MLFRVLCMTEEFTNRGHAPPPRASIRHNTVYQFKIECAFITPVIYTDVITISRFSVRSHLKSGSQYKIHNSSVAKAAQLMRILNVNVPSDYTLMSLKTHLI